MSDYEMLERRLNRERNARKQAEELIEQKSRQLYSANEMLASLNEGLEERIKQATSDLLDSNALLTKRLAELRALNSVANALGSELRISNLLDRILSVSKEVMGADSGAIFILDEDGKSLDFHVVSGERSEALKPLKVKLGQGIAGHVAKTGKTVRVEDAYTDQRFDSSFDQLSGYQTKSLIACPISVRGAVIGVLEVINKHDESSFDINDEGLFAALASSTGVAIENAKLFERTVAMAEDLREALEQERRLSIEKEKMGAYIPKSVVDEISRNREKKLALGGKTVWATVMFSDLKGFTKMSEKMPPKRLVDILNIYMTAMTDIIEDEHGVIDKFLGDGIMATFTAINDHEEGSVRAVQTGLRMQRKLTELVRGWQASYPEARNMQMRIGMNTGEMVAGNIGSSTRMEFTVIGDNVNVAARIESICEPGQILVSETTMIECQNKFQAIRKEPIQVKNRSQPVQTYEIKAE